MLSCQFRQSVGYRYQCWDASAGHRHNVIKTLNKNIHSQCHKCCGPGMSFISFKNKSVVKCLPGESIECAGSGETIDTIPGPNWSLQIT